MGEFSIRFRNDSENKDILVINLAGVLDSSAAGIFNHFVSSLPDKVINVICDFTAVHKITDYGFGLLSSFNHQLRSRGSHIRWVVPMALRRRLKHAGADVPPVDLEVAEAMACLGLPNRTDQLQEFVLHPQTTQVISGVPFSVEIEARGANGNILTTYSGLPHLSVDQGMVSPSLAVNFEQGIWKGSIIVTGPGSVRLKVADQDIVGEVILATHEEGVPAVFPVDISCPGCHRVNIAGKIDVFRCVECNTIYFVDRYAHVIPLKPGSSENFGFVKRIEFRIPSDVNYLNHVRNFIVGISSEERISEDKIAQIEMSLDEALANVVEHAYMYDAFQEICVEIYLYAKKMEILIADRGRSFDHGKLPLPDLKKHIEERKVGGLGRYLIKNLMDEVEYLNSARTNILRMVKRF